MVCVVSATWRRHVGADIVLGGKNSRHDADISSQGSIVVSTSHSLSRRLVVLSVSRDVHLVAWWSCQLVCLLSCGPRVV